MTELRRIMPILKARRDAASAALSALRARDRHLVAQIAGLREDRNALTDPEGLAVRTGRDLQWRRWADQRIAELEAERGRLRIDSLRAEAALRQAYGKCHGLERYIAISEKKARQLAARRADHAS